MRVARDLLGRHYWSGSVCALDVLTSVRAVSDCIDVERMECIASLSLCSFAVCAPVTFGVDHAGAYVGLCLVRIAAVGVGGTSE